MKANTITLLAGLSLRREVSSTGLLSSHSRQPSALCPRLTVNLEALPQQPDGNTIQQSFARWVLWVRFTEVTDTPNRDLSER